MAQHPYDPTLNLVDRLSEWRIPSQPWMPWYERIIRKFWFNHWHGFTDKTNKEMTESAIGHRGKT